MWACAWASSITYYALFLRCFDLNFLLDISYCVYWVVAEIWDSNLFHKICNKFFIHHCRAEGNVRLCVWNCLIFFQTEYSTVWPKICRVLSQFFLDSSIEFHQKVLTKKFSEIFALKDSLALFVKLSYFNDFIMSSYQSAFYFSLSNWYFFFIFLFIHSIKLRSINKNKIL